jgi:hypothetical protein
MFGLMYGVGLWSLMLELFKSFNLPVIPAQGGAGVSTGVPVACVTISACKQICALQGGIQFRLYEERHYGFPPARERR